MYKQPPKLVWDRRSKRWRRGGRWASPPSSEELRTNRAGHLIDDKGKRIPVSAPLRESLLKREFKHKLEPKEKPTIQKLSLAKPFVNGVLNSSSWNKRSPENISQIFEKILERASKRSPFEIQDILIYQNGLKFLGHRKLTKEEKEDLAIMALRNKVTINYADTNAGTEVYLLLGKDMKLADDVVNILDKKNEFIQKLYDTLIDYWGSLDWWYWFETEESLYE